LQRKGELPQPPIHNVDVLAGLCTWLA
jgi:hypothetical protein